MFPLSKRPLLPKYIPPVSSLKKTRSVPSIISFLRGDLSSNDGKVKVGLTLANKPKSFLILSKPCSGLTFAKGSLSYFGSPIAPNKIAFALKQIS